MSEKALVRLEQEGDVAVIVVDNPPVNALSPGVPEGITACLTAAEADPATKAIVLIGAGRSFIAGADIRQFGKGRPRTPIGERTYDVMDRASIPSSPPSTATPWAAGSNTPWAATTASACAAPRSACPRC